MSEVERQRWVPLSVREGKNEPFQPTVGVPPYLRPSIDQWFDSQMDPWEDFDGVAQLFALEMRIVPAPGTWGQLHKRMCENPTLYLDVLDRMLGGARDLDELERILWDADHEYRVDKTSYRLVKRIDGTMHAAYEAAVQVEDRASTLLQEAWLAVFSRSERSAENAWDKATAAVEAVLQPIVSPKDPKATLGKMLAALRDGGHKFGCDLPVGNDTSPIERFVQALSLVNYRPGRHGSDHREASYQQARAVVLQAVTIVSWLRDNVLWRVDLPA